MLPIPLRHSLTILSKKLNHPVYFFYFLKSALSVYVCFLVVTYTEYKLRESSDPGPAALFGNKQRRPRLPLIRILLDSE